jgi:glyoxylase-like metal-dependent hydrolase (beta-lactamase superfamily II)
MTPFPATSKPEGMRHLLLRSALLFFMAMAASVLHAQLPSSKHFRLEKLTPGVYAAIALPGGWAVCNAGIIDMGSYSIVVDPFLSPEAAADLRRAAEQLTGHPVRYVINTHAHSDHVRGNQVFRGTSEIISTATTLAEIARHEPGDVKDEQSSAPARLAEIEARLSHETDQRKRTELAFQQNYLEATVASLKGYTLTLPTITFDRRMTLHSTRRSIDLLAFEGGHTSSDLVVLLPEERIVFTGDLVFIECHPWLADGNPDNLIRTLELMRGMEINLVVPGHGPVGDADHFTAMIQYLRDLEALAQDALRHGVRKVELARISVPAAYADWSVEHFFLPNLRFMYDRAAGKGKP